MEGIALRPYDDVSRILWLASHVRLTAQSRKTLNAKNHKRKGENNLLGA
jgi:hypothetical protein